MGIFFGYVSIFLFLAAFAFLLQRPLFIFLDKITPAFLRKNINNFLLDMANIFSTDKAFFLQKRIQSLFVTILFSSIAFYTIFRLPNVTSGNRLLIIPRGYTLDQLKEKLKNEGHIKNTTTFLWAAYLLRYHPENKAGQYRLMGHMNNWEVIRMLRSGMQYPVKLTFSSAANKASLIDQLTSYIDVNKEALSDLLNDPKKLSTYGFTPDNILTMFIPDTYQVYWTITAEQLLTKMHLAYQRFWHTKRLNKAKKIGLDPVAVSILASIVQGETNNRQEAAMVAGVYFNRLKRNMPLQSCATLIYALKENQSGIKRVLEQDTYMDSTYNAYRRKGLPPGPIGLPSIAMIDAVLNYIPHDYLFFSAKEDFSGLHYFARNYKEHLKNAQKYRKALDNLKIMR